MLWIYSAIIVSKVVVARSERQMGEFWRVWAWDIILHTFQKPGWCATDLAGLGSGDGQVALSYHMAVFAQWNTGTLSPFWATPSSIWQEVVIHLPDFRLPLPLFVFIMFFFFSNAWACRTFNVVIINLIDLDFNSFIWEQLAKMLLTQKVYARLVSSILRRFPFKYTFDINFDLTTGVLFKLL